VRQQPGGTFTAAGWSGPIIVGTQGNDTLTGKAAATLILGLGGKDKITGKGGNDVICGGAGDDWLIGGGGNDSLDGGAGLDKLVGSAGFHDVLIGGDDSDLLSDVDGVAQASGGAGDDTISVVYKSGWKAPNNSRTIDNLTGGYENDKVNLSLGGKQLYLLQLSGDEHDSPPSLLEGANDILAVTGPVDPASNYIKFEQIAIRPAAAEEIDESAIIETWRAAGEWVDETEDTNRPSEQARRLFIPVVVR